LEAQKAQGQIQPYRQEKKIPKFAMGKIGFGQKSESLYQVPKNVSQEKIIIL